jgi:flagellar biosynthesis chaperone FliJ
MKRFQFPLSRVKDWRAVQVRVEESKLQTLYAELRAIDSKKTALLSARAESEQALLASPSATSQELSALDAFRRHVVAESTRLEHARMDCQKRLSAQMKIVAGKRRDVRLLDRLKDDRLQAWQSAYAREIDAQAGEAYLARWRPPA